MKTTRLLRVLSLLGFLLLMAPFYDSCDGHIMKQAEAVDALVADTTAIKVDSTKINSIDIEKTKVDTINNSVTEKETSFFQKIYDAFVDEDASNGFEIAEFSVFAIRETTFKEFKEEFPKSFQKKDWYKDLGLFISFLFDFIILISFSIFILSFTKKTKLLNKLALVNSILIIITLLYIIFLESSFENFRQIKWGYYAFIMTNLLIYYYSRPNKIKT